MASSEYVGLTIERVEHLAIVTLTRPEVMNRIDDTMHVELTNAFRDRDRISDIRAVVLASTGKHFSAGGDFDLMMMKHDDIQVRWAHAADGLRLLTSFLEIRLPVVAAIHGDAIGLGATIALACDVGVSHPRARIYDPHVQIGLSAGDGGCLLWPSHIGMARAKRYLLTGDPLTALDAKELGLITDLVDQPEDVLPAALALAHRIAHLAPIGIQATKRALNHVMLTRLNEVMELNFAYSLTVLGTDDLVEAIAAFKEKRDPIFKGR